MYYVGLDVHAERRAGRDGPLLRAGDGRDAADRRGRPATPPATTRVDVRRRRRRSEVGRANGLRWGRTPRTSHEADEDLDGLKGGRPRTC
jgi:hypothetical protein